MESVPPMIQTASIMVSLLDAPATSEGVRKMPAPMMMPTVSAMTSRRRRVGLMVSGAASVRNFPPRSPFKRITGGGTGRWKQACHRTARASLCSLGDSGYHGSSGRCPALQAHLTSRCDNRSVGAPASIDVGPDRKSDDSGKSVSGSVAVGGSRLIKKQNNKRYNKQY